MSNFTDLRRGHVSAAPGESGRGAAAGAVQAGSPGSGAGFDFSFWFLLFWSSLRPFSLHLFRLFGCVLGSPVRGHRAGASQVADKQDGDKESILFPVGITHFHHYSNAI